MELSIIRLLPESREAASVLARGTKTMTFVVTRAIRRALGGQRVYPVIKFILSF